MGLCTSKNAIQPVRGAGTAGPADETIIKKKSYLRKNSKETLNVTADSSRLHSDDPAVVRRPSHDLIPAGHSDSNAAAQGGQLTAVQGLPGELIEWDAEITDEPSASTGMKRQEKPVYAFRDREPAPYSFQPFEQQQKLHHQPPPPASGGTNQPASHQKALSLKDRPISEESLIYAQRHFLDFEHNLANGSAIFCYAGMCIDATMGMRDLKRCLELGPNHEGPETLLVGFGCDPGLDDFILCMRKALTAIPDERRKLQRLSQQIANRLGGEGDSSLVAQTNMHIKNMQQRAGSAVVRLGDLKYGVCRHRAIMFKVCCDALGLKCRLVQGDYRSQYGGGLHAWNVVLLYGELKVVDIMHTPGEFYDSDHDKVSHYHRLVDHAFGRGSGMSVAIPKQHPGHLHPNSIQIAKHPGGQEWLLGKGGFGEVFKGKINGNLDVAVKKLSLYDTFNVQEFRKEVDILYSLRDEHVITFKGACLDAGNCFLVTELAGGGDLASALREHKTVMSWSDHGLRIALQVAKGLCYLHSCSPPVAHRDLKPQNVLLTENMAAKISDFGLSLINKGVVMAPQESASLPYAAPEVVRNQPSTLKVDIYSFGVMLKEIVLQCKPRPPEEFRTRSLPDGCPATLQKLIIACLDEAPDKRPSAPALVSELDALVQEHCRSAWEARPPPIPHAGIGGSNAQTTYGSGSSLQSSAATTGNVDGSIISEEADQFLRDEVGLEDDQLRELRKEGAKNLHMLQYITSAELRKVGAVELQVKAFLDGQKLRWPKRGRRDGGTGDADEKPLQAKKKQPQNQPGGGGTAGISSSVQRVMEAGRFSGQGAPAKRPSGTYSAGRMCSFSQPSIQSQFSSVGADWDASGFLALGRGYVMQRDGGGWRSCGVAVGDSLEAAGNAGWGIQYVTIGPNDQYFYRLGASGGQRSQAWSISTASSADFSSRVKEQDCGVEFAAIGERGAYYIQFDNGSTCWKNIPEELSDLLSAKWDRKEKIVELSLGANGMWFMKDEAGNWEGAGQWPKALQDHCNEKLVDFVKFGDDVDTWVMQHLITA